MKYHTLKCWPSEFAAIRDGLKTFEFRKNDRNFKTGDAIQLMEWDPITKEYTGEKRAFTITYILLGGPSPEKDLGDFGVPDEYCVLAIKPVQQGIIIPKTFGHELAESDCIKIAERYAQLHPFQPFYVLRREHLYSVDNNNKLRPGETLFATVINDTVTLHETEQSMPSYDDENPKETTT